MTDPERRAEPHAGTRSSTPDDLREAVRSLTNAVSACAATAVAQAAAVNHVLAVVRALREQTDHPRDPALVAAVRHIYWQHAAVPSRELAQAAGFQGPGEMTEAIGPAPSGVTCPSCRTELRRTSRSWKPPTDSLCPQCTRERTSQRNRQWDNERLRTDHVETGPVVATAREWYVATTLILAYPPVTIGWDTETAERNGLWLGYDTAQNIDTSLAGFPIDADVPIQLKAAKRLVETAEMVADWDSDEACRLVEHVTEETPTTVLTRLAQRVDATRSARKAEARRLYPDDHTPDPKLVQSLVWGR